MITANAIGNSRVANSESSTAPAYAAVGSPGGGKQNPGGGSETQCTGDGSAYGSSGPRVAQSLPNTDPTQGAANRLAVTRSLFYDSPGRADGPRRKAQVVNPLQTTVANWP